MDKICSTHSNIYKFFCNTLSFIKFMFVFGFVSNNIAQTNNIRFKQLNFGDGLSNSNITSIIQDNDGFIWIGTKNGLNKYDGYNFKVYKTKPSNQNSLSDNSIRSLDITPDGILLIATENGGLSFFDPIYEEFYLLSHIPINPNSLISDNLNVVYLEPDTSATIIWIGSMRNGLDMYDAGMNVFTHYKHNRFDKTSISNDNIRSIFKDTHGNLWVGTDHGLNRLSKDKKRWIKYFYDKRDINALSNSEVKVIYEDHENNLWIGTGYGLNKVIFPKPSKNGSISELDKIRFKRIILKNNKLGIFDGSITSIYEDHQNNLWVGEHYGLHKYDKTENKDFIYRTQRYNYNSISGNLVNAIFVDATGLIWIGTEGSGLNYLNLKSNNFKLISSIEGVSNSLSSPSIRGIYVDDEDILWAGGYNGLNKVDRKNKAVTHYSPSNSGLNSKFIYKICPDYLNKNILWIGTEGEGMDKFYKDTGEAEKIDFAKIQNLTDINYNFVFDIYQDKSGILWLATNQGLIKYNSRNRKVKVYAHFDNKNSISGNKIRVIIKDRNEFLWIGTERNGLDLFNLKTEKFTNYTHDQNNPKSLSNNRIKSIYEDNNGNIWVGTNGGGLNKFERETGTFEHFTEIDGFPDDTIYGILEDNSNNLWLSTNNGISRFNIDVKRLSGEKLKIKNYNISDGLQGSEFNTASYFKSKSGEMFFGGTNGLNYFFPKKIKDYKTIFPIVITDFLIYNKSVQTGDSINGMLILEKNITNTNVIQLSYIDDMISFEFATLNFGSSQKNKYAYKLEGYDNDWIITDASKRFATYTQLSPGNYVFLVKSANNEDYWDETAKAINIIITPPWWKTSWAYFLYIIIFFVIVYSIIQNRINAYKSVLEMKIKIQKTKIEERRLVLKETSKDFHDDLGNKFTKIALFGELAKRNTHSNPDETIKYLNQVINTSKSLSGGMRDFIWTLDPEQNSMYDVAIRLKDFGETLFNSFGIKFQMEGLSEEYHEIKLNMNQRRNIILIAKEAMNNILKHANSGNVSLNIEYIKSILNICISDDGIGFDKKKKTSGYGFRNMKSRAKSIGGALNVDSSPENGTSICLLLNLTSRIDAD